MMDAVNRAIQAAQLDLLAKQMNMQNQAYFNQQTQLAAQQAQQQAYAFGWHDPSALQAVQQKHSFHLAGDLMDDKPSRKKLRVPLYVYMIFVSVLCIALGLFLKLQGN